MIITHHNNIKAIARNICNCLKNICLQGWSDLDVTYQTIKSDPKWEELAEYGQTLITQQSTEILKSFTFWPSPDERDGSSLYEISSYTLKPGIIC